MALAFLSGGLIPVAAGILPSLVATAPNDKDNPRMNDAVMEWRSRYLAGDDGSFTSSIDLEGQHFSVLLVCIPQGGYGDIVFMRKFAATLKGWYPHCSINVLSQDERCRDDERWGFYRLATSERVVEEGSAPLDMVRWADATWDSPRLQAHDMVFVLPHLSMQSFENWAYPLDMILSKFVEGVSPLNAVSVGEYNESYVDVFTGIPDSDNPLRTGLLIDDPPSPVPLPESLVDVPFVIAYVTPTPGYAADDDMLDDMLVSSFAVFCKAATASSSVAPTVLVPPGVPERLGGLGASLGREVHMYREGVAPPTGAVCIRGLDTLGLSLPLEHSMMCQLMRSSAGFVMVTGDQSLTDAISVARSCCPRMRIFYQRTIWKEDFFKLVVTDPTAEVGAAEIRDDLKDTPPDFRELGKPVIDRALRLSLDPSERVVEELRSLYSDFCYCPSHVLEDALREQYGRSDVAEEGERV